MDEGEDGATDSMDALEKQIQYSMTDSRNRTVEGKWSN